MSRAMWFVAGAASGVYGLVKARRAAENLTPDGLAARAESLKAGAREFANQVNEGASARETELREQLQLPPEHKRRRAVESRRREIPSSTKEATTDEGS